MKRYFVFCAALGLAACGTDGSTVVTGVTRPSVDPAQVVLYLTPPADYETIGLVSAKSGTHGSDDSKMQDAVQKLKEEAGEAGANGIIIQQTGEATSGSTGVVLQSGQVPMFFSSTHHRETINGTAIYVPPNGNAMPVGEDFRSASSGAEKGDPVSQYDLGLFYMQGTGVPQNYLEALKWLLLAKASADGQTDTYMSANSAIEKLEARMEPAQVAQAQQEAAEWFKAHQDHG